jgi:hypothetical protein
MTLVFHVNRKDQNVHTEKEKIIVETVMGFVHTIKIKNTAKNVLRQLTVNIIKLNTLVLVVLDLEFVHIKNEKKYALNVEEVKYVNTKKNRDIAKSAMGRVFVLTEKEKIHV